MKRNTIKSVTLTTLLGIGIATALASPAHAIDSSAFLRYADTCVPGVTLFHSGLSQKRFDAVCKEIEFARSAFTPMFGNTPAANDRTESIEIHASQTSSENAKLNALFGDDVEGRSVYYENDANAPGNVGEVHLNLDRRYPVADSSVAHEYVHYLDGHINHAGSGDSRAPIQWWAEGIAETLTDRDPAWAVENFLEYDYRLSDIMSNEDNGDDDASQALVYSGGELAVRFFMIKHPELIREMLGYTKAGEYKKYASWFRRIGTSYDREFSDFVDSQSGKITKLPTVDFTSSLPSMAVTLPPPAKNPLTAGESSASKVKTKRRLVKTTPKLVKVTKPKKKRS